MKYAVLLITNFGKNMETNQQFRANFQFIRNKGDLSKQHHRKQINPKHRTQSQFWIRIQSQQIPGYGVTRKKNYTKRNQES